jgi:hypothetical protein
MLALVLKDQAEEARAGFAAATKGQSGGELRDSESRFVSRTGIRSECSFTPSKEATLSPPSRGAFLLP